MKDLPHHLKKINRRIIRSVHREELENEAFDISMLTSPPWEQTERQIKKQAKAKLRKERESRAPTPLTPEERNKKMLKRVPVFNRLHNAKPRSTRPTHKKTPRI